MDVFKDLYRVLILFSAGVILLGMVLNLRLGKKISASMKMLLILAVVNLASMSVFLLNLNTSNNPDIAIAFVFINSVILLLNLIIGRYLFVLHTSNKARFDNQIKHLFLVSFAAECLFLLLIFAFRAEADVFDINNDGFPYVYAFILSLLIWGTVIPGFRSVVSLFHREQTDKRIYLLLILNMLNNIIGLVFFELKYPSENVGLMANMLINIVFAYYYGFYMISSYFEVRKMTDSEVFSKGPGFYTWPELKKHLNHWGETSAYLNQFNPELIKKVDACSLSDLEKIHYALRLLNIKSKDIADAMNISTRAVEMQRYRINKKIGKQ